MRYTAPGSPLRNAPSSLLVGAQVLRRAHHQSGADRHPRPAEPRGEGGAEHDGDPDKDRPQPGQKITHVLAEAHAEIPMARAKDRRVHLPLHRAEAGVRMCSRKRGYEVDPSEESQHLNDARQDPHRRRHGNCPGEAEDLSK
jgi:hypothetical protein